MSVAFRVDASVQIGTGHVMRCRTLARRLRAGGAHVRFVSRFLPEYLVQLIQSEGIEVRVADDRPVEVDGDLAHSTWLGTSQLADAEDSQGLLADRKWDWLIVDHYALDARWESEMRDCAVRIMAIDDIADRMHDCELLLDQNLYMDMHARYVGKVPPSCLLTLGPEFALLHEDFARLRGTIRPRSGAVNRILVFMGGIDEHDCTSFVLSALALSVDKRHEIDVVVGAKHPRRGAIELYCREREIRCHVQTTEMAALMASADLAIGAGGAATWERCCLGVPTITLSLAENQVGIARAVHDYGACRYLGTCEEVNLAMLTRAVEAALRSPVINRAMSERAYELVDGLGADRICRYLN